MIKTTALEANTRGHVLGWAILVSFYLFQYMLRICVGLFEQNIRAEWKIDATMFATLGSCYLITYAISQIPLGIILDKVGVRKMTICGMSLCILSLLLLLNAEFFFIAQLSRVLLGLGSASAFMCSIKYINDNLSESTRPIYIGLTVSVGTFSALVANKFDMAQVVTWTEFLNTMLVVGVGVALLVFFMVRNSNASKSSKTLSAKQVKSDVLKILQNKRILLLCFFTIPLYAPLAFFADLWGPAFLREKFQLSKVTQLGSLMYLGMCIGGFVVPYIAQKISQLRKTIGVCTIIVTALFCILIYVDIHSKAFLFSSLFCVGFFCGAEMICFSVGLLEVHNKRVAGTVSGLLNTFNMGAAALFQQITGFLLDINYNGKMIDGVKMYSIEDFVYSMTPFCIFGVCMSCIALFLLLFYKDL